MHERRTRVRLSAGFPVTHILGEDEQHAGVVEDLSADGMRIAVEAEEGWRRSRFAWLQFTLPGDERVVIRALGELCHEGGNTRGFRFKYIYPRDRRRFEAFVNDRSTAALAG